MTPRTKQVIEEIDWRIRVFDSLSFPTLILKPNLEIISANQVLLDKYGLELDDIVGMTCFQLLFSGDRNCIESDCPLARVLEDKKGHSVLKRIVDENGQHLWEDRVFSPILDDDGRVAYIIESFRDVTRQKILERNLREAEDFLEKVVESSPSAILAADQGGQLILANQAAEDLFGHSFKQDFPRITTEKLYPPGQARQIMRMMRRGTPGHKGKLPPTKTVIVNDKGETIPVEMTAAIIYDEGREAATMAIYNDLRDKIRAEERLKQAQAQLAQAEKLASIGQLAAGVAHEINNPLTGILFYASLALEALGPDSPIREDLEYVIEDVHRCKTIVRNLLAYSRQQSSAKVIVQINDLMDRALSLIRDQKVFRHIRINRDFSEEMMLVQVDANQFSQVIINLVMNALAAMEGEGVLTLRTYRDKAAGKVYLEVGDTGAGIPADHLSKIFDPFFTTKPLGKGTGLGLSTVYGIVQEHAGTVSVKKTGPDGTTFVVILPLYQASADLPPASYSETEQGAAGA